QLLIHLRRRGGDGLVLRQQQQQGQVVHEPQASTSSAASTSDSSLYTWKERRRLPRHSVATIPAAASRFAAPSQGKLTMAELDGAFFRPIRNRFASET